MGNYKQIDRSQVWERLHAGKTVKCVTHERLGVTLKRLKERGNVGIYDLRTRTVDTIDTLIAHPNSIFFEEIKEE